MELLLGVMIFIVIGYGLFEAARKFFRKKGDLKKTVDSARKGYEQEGELLQWMPELCPMITKRVRRNGKMVSKQVKDIPKAIRHGNFIDIQFSKACNPKTVHGFTKYIANQFYGKKAIASPLLKIVDESVNGDPYVIRYKIGQVKKFISYKAGFLSKIKNDYHKFLDSIKNPRWAMFFGETIDPLQDIDAQIVIDLLDGPHCLVVGESGSGKTTTIVSMIYALARMYPGLTCYFSDGKESFDYQPLAKKFSPLPVAFPEVDGEDPMIHLAEMLTVYVQGEWDRRKKLFLEAGTTNYSEYNKKFGDVIKPVVVVVDEFAAWAGESPVSPESTQFEKGTIFGTLRKLLAEARNAGIIVIIGNQGITSEIPPIYRKNLNNILIHRTKETGYVAVPKDKMALLGGKEEKGKFVFWKKGFTDVDGSEFIVATMPYVDDKNLFNELDIPVPAQFEFNNSLIYNKGSGSGKVTLNGQAGLFREYFFKPAKWDILHEELPSLSLSAFVIQKGEQKLHVSFIEAAKLHEEVFFDHLNRYTKEQYKECRNVVFTLGSTPVSRIPKLREAFDENGFGLILEEDYTREFLKAAAQYNEDKLENEIFDDLLKMYSVRPKESMAAPTLIKPANKIELTKEFLTKIMEMPAKNDSQSEKKGAIFEQFMKELFIYAGYWAGISTDLFSLGYREKPKKGDGGLDLLIVPRPKNEDGSLTEVDIMNLPEELLSKRIVVQAKNYNKTNLGNEIVSDLVKASELYAGPSGIEVTELWLVHTNGTLSAPFIQEMNEINARGRLNIKVFSMKDIIKLLPEEVRESDADKIIHSDLSLDKAVVALKEIGIVMSRQTVKRARDKKKVEEGV